MIPLPIDAYLPKILAILRESNGLILSAPPGTGKTTRIPRALYDAGFAEKGEILILEPRRLAARLAASRVAQELDEKVGETVGYSIRFENVSGPKTRIRFLTEDILARRMVHNPNLEGISIVILDEFHERHLATDLSLAFLKQLQTINPKLKIIVMSATLDAKPVASFLENARELSIEGSPFDLRIEYEEKASDRPLQEKVAAAVSRLFRSGLKGDILTFLPGAAEIRRATEALKPVAGHFGLRLYPLHGDLPSSEQKHALDPSEQIKVILATNVAETSITIPGIAAVIDSGLARVSGHSAWSGLPTLSTQKISKSSAIQRAGRAGRTQDGRVLRLYTRMDFESRQEHEIPEIRRADLAEAVLLLHCLGIRDINNFPWFEAPAASSMAAAEMLLIKLGAIDSQGRVMEDGVRMVQMPVHPRLARMILEGERRHVADECTLLAALLSERDIRLDVRTNLRDAHSKMGKAASGPSDLLELMERFQEAENARFESGEVHALGLDLRAVHAVRRGQRQLRRMVFSKSTQTLSPAQSEEALLIAALAGFPDRVARRRKQGSQELVMAGGGTGMLSPASVVHQSMFVVAVDAEERKEKVPSRISGSNIRLASAIEIEWLADLFPEDLLQKTELIWNDRAGRVDEVKQTVYGQIVLEETVRPATPSVEAANLLASALLSHSLSPLRDHSSLPALQSRLELLSRCFPEEQWPEMGDSEIRDKIKRLCIGKRSLEELASVSILDAFIGMLTDRQQKLLGRETPERIRLKSGHNLKVHYEPAKPPWIESRLQDFFGTASTPAICGGNVSLTIHLLAPNRRAVQITQDLEGFWEKHYPSIRRELQRRYPKHAWPEL